MKSITVLKVSPGCSPEVISIPHTLEAMQTVVGGSIQAVYPFEDSVAMVCNEEGKVLNMEPNRAIRDRDTGEIQDVICGTFFICGLTEDDFGSLTNAQIAKYSKLFETPEMFLWNGNQLIVLRMNQCT